MLTFSWSLSQSQFGRKLEKKELCLEKSSKQEYGINKNLLLHVLAIRLRKKKKHHNTSIAHPIGTIVLHTAVRTAELHKTTRVL